MSGSHHGIEPDRDARYTSMPTAVKTGAVTPVTSPQQGNGDHGLFYDCRTLPEQERDDVAALRADVAALKYAVAHQADAIQVLVLRVEELERERGA